jgi:hypothetical protein
MPGVSPSIWCRYAKQRSLNCRSSLATVLESVGAGEATKCWRGCCWATTQQQSWRLSSRQFATVRPRRTSAARSPTPQLCVLPCLAHRMSIRLVHCSSLHHLLQCCPPTAGATAPLKAMQTACRKVHVADRSSMREKTTRRSYRPNRLTPGIDGVRSRPRRSVQVEGHASSVGTNPDA